MRAAQARGLAAPGEIGGGHYGGKLSGGHARQPRLSALER